MLLADPERFSPERCEHFVATVMGLVWAHIAVRRRFDARDHGSPPR